MAPKAPSQVLPEAWEIWNRTFRYPTETLYHYTSADALLSILTAKSMWATNLLYTSDPTDLIHGENVVRDALDTAIATYTDDFTREWLDGFKHTTRLHLEQNDFYSISFCTEGDLLSQWRAYGTAGGGFSMGWNPVSHFPGDPFRVGVTYDRTLQTEVALAVIQRHAREVQGLTYQVTEPEYERVSRATGSLGVFLSMCLYSFKHPAFASEDEFRWVYPSYDHQLPSGVQLQFRRFESIVKPYIEVDFSKADLVEIIFGPTADPSTAKWLKAALDTHGFASTGIRPSLVPMRPT